MASITSNPIDFSSTALAENYIGFFATVLENVFTPEECANFLSRATTDTDWTVAGVNAETLNHVSKTFRDSDRILHDDEESAQMIYDRIIPLLPPNLLEIHPGGEYEGVVGASNMKFSKARRETGYWKARILNPRLRFLKYGPGQFFKPHCDGLGEFNGYKSFVTVHIYLNDSTMEGGPVGGATRFWSPNKKQFLDVEPKLGQILIFQQRMLVHSGELVTEGVKFTLRTDLMYEKVVVGQGGD